MLQRKFGAKGNKKAIDLNTAKDYKSALYFICLILRIIFGLEGLLESEKVSQKRKGDVLQEKNKVVKIE